MATDYPNGIDNFVNPTASDTLDSATVPHATQHANANDAIEAIENELGTNPKGTYASVKARLDAATPNDTANEVVKRDANQAFSIGAINFDTASTQTSAVGKLYWDGNGSLALGLLGGNVTVGINEDLVCYVTNAEATTLNVGEVVYLYGAQGDRPTVKRASNTSDATSAKTFGFVAESIAANQAGFVTIRGTVRKVNTSAFNPGDPLYLGSTAGTFTNVKPSAPNHLVYLGVVERANAGNGQIQVVVQNGYELDEIHDVSISSKTDGQLLVYEASTNLWKNKSISATAPITYDASTRTIAANTGIANGLATLDSTGKVPQAQLPAVAITNTYVVNSQSAMLALTAEEGDVAIRTDVSKSYILTAVPASTLGNWQELLSPPDAVTSVDGRTGVVTLTDKYAQLATANTFTGSQTATSFVVTGSTAPANGIYLPSANTLGLATNSTVRLQIDANGNVGIGAAPVSISSLLLSKNITGGTDSRVVQIAGVIQSDVTSVARIFFSSPTTQAASFTLSSLTHFQAAGTTIGAGSAITSQSGFVASAALMTSGVTNAYGFRGLIASASNAWNVYMDGTAANYFAGQTTIGSTSLTLGSLSVAQQFGIVSAAASNVVAVIRGAASQTGDLTQWQNSAATTLAKVDASGNIFAPTLQSTTASTATLTTNGDTGGLLVGTVAATNKGVTVKGVASQSADLQQWQNSSGTVLDAFDANGNQRSQTQLIQYGAEGSVLQNVPTRVHPAETLLKQAVWWIDAAHSTASSQTISNLGWGGSALNVTNGSSTSADSNDALYLPWDGTNYAYFPGVNGSNNLSIPDAANLRITGDIDLRAQIAMDDWTPGTSQRILSKYPGGGSNISYILLMTTTGNIMLYWSTTGTNLLSATSTASVSATDGTVKWIRATLDVDNGASGRDIRFFTSDDGITWTQLGTTLTQSGTTSIFAGTSAVYLGSDTSNTETFTGKIYRAQILNGIDGVPVLDVDTSVISSGSATSFTALTGQTVTVNRSTSGRKTTCVVNPVWLFGTDDYMEVNNRWLGQTGSNYLYLPGVSGNYASSPDSAAISVTGDIDLRVQVALDDWTPSAQNNLISKWSSATDCSYIFWVNTTGTLVLNWTSDGVYANRKTAQSSATGLIDGSVKWVRATLTVNNGAGGNDVKFYTSDDGTTWTQLGSTITTAGTTSIFDSTSALTIGTDAINPGGNLARGKFFRAQVYNGIGGTLAFDANFETSITTNLPTTFTESSANAATVTINYSGTSYRSCGVIASTYVYPGNPNTFKLSTTSLLDFGATDSMTAFVAVRQWATPTSFGRFLAKSGTSTVNGYTLANNGTNANLYAFISDGTNTATRQALSTITAGSITPLGMVIDRSGNTLASFGSGTVSATTSTSSVGSLSNPYTLGIGRENASTGGYQDFEFIAAAIFRRALSAAEIATLSNYYAGRYGA